jgi:hypothetical protein
MKNILIVFSGKAQSGKTTASKALKSIIDAEVVVQNPDINPNRLGDSRVKILSFATALKQIAETYFNWDGDKGIYMQPLVPPQMVMENIESSRHLSMSRSYLKTEEPIPDRGRQLLINIGQHMRAIRPTIWVDYVINKIKNEGSTGTDKVFIIDDMRFSNELILAKTFDICISVRLRRDSELNLNDTSETDLDNAEFDYYVENNGSMDDLKAEMSGLFEKIKLKYQ